MSNSNCEGCIFRHFQDDPEIVPESMADAVGALSAMDDEPTKTGDAAGAYAILEAPACSVEGCKVTIGGLFKYIMSAGSDAPRQALDEVVGPCCAILDVPHQLDEDVGSFFNDPNNPLA